MPKYQYKSPSGAVYEFDGPEELTPELMASVKKNVAEWEKEPRKSEVGDSPPVVLKPEIEKTWTPRSETPTSSVNLDPAAETLGKEDHGILIAFLVLVAWLALVKLVHSTRFEHAKSERERLNLFEAAVDSGSKKKVGGWLKFYAVSLTFWAPLQVFGFAGSFAGIMEQAYNNRHTLTMPLMQDNSLLLAYVIRAHLVVSTVIAILCFTVGIKIWRARPTALLWLRRLWWVDIGWQGCFLALFLCINPHPERWGVNCVVLVVSTLSMLLWRAYFVRSKRVRDTFGHWVCSAHRETTIFDEIITPAPSASASGGNSQARESAGEDLPVAATTANEEQPIQALPPEQAADNTPAPHESINEAAPPRTMLDCYTQIAAELERGEKHAGAWLMAVTEAGGEGPQAMLLYNKLRAQMLMAAEPVNSSM